MTKYRVVEVSHARGVYYIVQARYLFFFWTKLDASAFATQEGALSALNQYKNKPHRVVVYEE